jgi:hypothetical protein
MGSRKPPDREVLLAVALGSEHRAERRMLPDRRSGVERRKESLDRWEDRRSAIQRRQVIRRQTDRDDGATLLQKARTQLLRWRRGGSREGWDDGLR